MIKTTEQMTLQTCFEARVKKSGKDLAIIDHRQSFTYAELDAKANQLAHFLKRYHIKPDNLAGIYLDRGVDTIVSVFGIIKAGGAYLPFDTEYPQSRLNFVIEEAKPSVIITHAKYKAHFKDYHGNVIVLDELEAELLKQPTTNPPVTAQPNHLAYVIYTSGTTAHPKGVMIEHRNIVSKLTCLADIYQFTASDKTLFYRSFAYDGSIEEYLLPLLFGGQCIILAPETKLSLIDHMLFLIQKYQITLLNVIPSLMPYFLDALQEHHYYVASQSIKTIVVGGEVFPIHLARKLLKKTAAKVFNIYGPTEGTIDTTIYTVGQLEEEKVKVPIGKPLPDTEVYVLNHDEQLVADKTIGELYIGGRSIARGYWNNLELTQEKFIANPFSQEKESRLYRTGDLVQWNDQGDLEFIGRRDNQIKLRGYRIELEEIDIVLQKHPSVQRAITLFIDQEQEGRLIAFVLPNSEAGFSVKCLKRFLIQHLPTYMLPNRFIILESWPTNNAGKVNVKELMNRILLETSMTQESISDEITKALLTIWKQVLQHKHIHLDENFFMLGGNSLLAMDVLKKIEEKFNYRLTQADFFEYPTIIQMVELIKKQKELAPNTTKNETDLIINDQQKRFPLTYSQTLLFNHELLYQGEPLYNEPLVITMPSEIHVPLLEKSINHLLKAHDVLRMRFDSEEGILFQYPAAHKPIQLPFYDFVVDPALDQIAIADQMIKKKFDFCRENPIRFVLFKTKQQEYQLYIVAHHIISDGISMFEHFPRELEETYHRYLQDESIVTEKVAQYQDYAVWLEKYLVAQDFSEDIAYWETTIKQLPQLHFPTKKNVSKDLSAGALATFHLPATLSRRLKSYASEQGSTIFSLLFAAYNILLYRYTNSRDLVVGSVISMRQHSATEKMLGNFLNTVLLRNKIDPNVSFTEFLSTVQHSLNESYRHARLPFLNVLQLMHVGGELNQHDFMPMQTAFIFETPAYKSDVNWEISQLGMHADTAKFELMFELDDREDKGFIGRVEYKKALFSKELIEQMIIHYRRLLEKIVDNEDCPLTSLDGKWLLDQQLFTLSQKTCGQPPSVIKTFELIAKKAGRKLALSYQGRELTYLALNAKANQLAHYLQKRIREKEGIVGVYLDRGIDSIIALLAIMKAGCAYLPLDLQLPQNRLDYIMHDAKPEVIITHSDLSSHINFHHEQVLLLDQVKPDVDQESTENLRLKIDAANLAYIIYTSGSTGMPKGIMLEHKTLNNLTAWQSEELQHKDIRRVAQFASLAFDVSLQEIFYALTQAKTLYIVEDKVRKQAPLLYQLLPQHKIDLLFLPTAVLPIFCEVAQDEESLTDLTDIIVSGEQLTITPQIKQFFLKNPQTTLHNQYGPSETHVVTQYTLPKDPNTWAQEPAIGKAIDGVHLNILSADEQPCPSDVVGELCISGDVLARGYLNDEKLTSEKFVKSSALAGKVMYKTGDLVRASKEGLLEFVGRKDNQVKVLGYRIELKEIEHHILESQLVSACVVLSIQMSQAVKKLVAFIVPSDQDFNEQALRDHLSERLPAYMLPSDIVSLSKMPLTTNQKVDKETLKSHYLAMCEKPRVLMDKVSSEYMDQIIEIWKTVLDLESISQESHFFKLGGNSLLAVQLITSLNKAFSVNLQPCQLLKTPILKDLVSYISRYIKTEN